MVSKAQKKKWCVASLFDVNSTNALKLSYDLTNVYALGGLCERRLFSVAFFSLHRYNMRNILSIWNSIQLQFASELIKSNVMLLGKIHLQCGFDFNLINHFFFKYKYLSQAKLSR